MEALRDAHQAATGQFPGFQAERRREIRLAGFTFEHNPVTCTGDGPRVSVLAGQALAARAPGRVVPHLLAWHGRPLAAGLAQGRAGGAQAREAADTGTVRAHPELFAEAGPQRLASRPATLRGQANGTA